MYRWFMLFRKEIKMGINVYVNVNAMVDIARLSNHVF